MSQPAMPAAPAPAAPAPAAPTPTADGNGPGGGAAATGQPLKNLQATAPSLTLHDRRLLVAQALVLLEGNYVHLPLKRSLYAVNPVQRLRVLASRLSRQSPATMDPEWMFHREMSSIFHSVRDLHTNYLLPEPFASHVAFLPFSIERVGDSGNSRYIVTRIVQGFAAAGFGPGAEVTHWNGTPVERAAALNGLAFAGSNPAANFARGLDSLTMRPLRIQLPPDENWVTVNYIGTDNVARETRVDWRVVRTGAAGAADDAAASLETQASQGLDLDSELKSQARKLLYFPEVATFEAAAAQGTLGAADGDIPTSFPSVLRARKVTTPHGEFGYIRIFSFNVSDPDRFLREFVRLTNALPRNGLIIDVRDNGGGHIFASEFLLQTLTPHPITPEPTQFISTELNLGIVSKHKANQFGIDLGPWFDSLDEAVESGATFSTAHPITPPQRANALGQTYHGPVVLITDARCYSATDIFAGGFADHKIGKILGIDDCTGAGGANVWTHSLLSDLMRVDNGPSPYQPLPQGSNMRVSIRRTLRVGDKAGSPVEDFGVRPDLRHAMTLRDVLEDNVDLIAAAGKILAGMPVRRLDLRTDLLTTTGKLGLHVAGLDRVDVYLDGRPVATADIADDGEKTVDVPGASARQLLEVRGFNAGQLVAARKTAI